MTEPVQPRLDEPESELLDHRRGRAETLDAYVRRMLKNARQQLQNRQESRS